MMELGDLIRFLFQYDKKNQPSQHLLRIASGLTLVAVFFNISTKRKEIVRLSRKTTIYRCYLQLRIP